MTFSLSILKKLPVQLVLCLLIGLSFGNAISLNSANILYTISCFIKDILMYALPFIIFTYLWAAIISFGNRGKILIGITVCLLILANACALLTAYGLGSLILPTIIKGSIPHITYDATVHVTSLWNIPDWQFIKPPHGMISGILLGFITLATQSPWLTKNSQTCRIFATNCLKKGFIPVLPLYVLGFVIKLSRDGQLTNLMHGYANAFIFICILMTVYITFWYFVGNAFNVKNTIASIREMLPAGITGFTTMSSSASMPVTLAATEKNINDRPFANFIVPASVNPHMVGDGLCITVTALALLLMAGKSIPPLSIFLIYTVNYCLVKFSAAGVPGGGVIVILPVVRDYLGLDEASTALLQTIYLLQDPIMSSANVMGNGAFAMVTHRLLKPWLGKNDELEDECINHIDHVKKEVVG